MANQAMNYLYSGRSPGRLGNAHPNVVPYQDFPTADGNVIIAVGNDGQFARLVGALGQPELAVDARFATNLVRVAHRAELIRMLRQQTIRRTTTEWVAALEAVEVPCGPINDLAHVFDDPQVLARGMKLEAEHPTAGPIPLVANPIRLSASPVEYRNAPPTLGQHTVEVLSGVLGYGADGIAELQAKKVI